MEIPIYSKLEDYHRKNRISFAMPGHKNLRGLAPDLQKCDVTELAETVDLHHESAEFVRANELLAEYYGVKRSFILTCGSTAGIQTMLTSVLKPGDVLLAAADCHMSVINTCAICGFKLRLIPVEYDGDVPRGLAEFDIPEDVSAVLVTSPNYYGIVKNIRKIADMCHARNLPLLVDEAHGAHFKASPDLPPSAADLGADMVCHSAHKTLNALTGAAYLHICSDRINIGRVRKAIAAFMTSSPSYPIAASADAARATLAEMNYRSIIDECRQFKEAICHATKIRAVENDDITRIVLNFAAYDISGFKVADMLSGYFGIDIEMADHENIVLIATPWNTHRDFMPLFAALTDIVKLSGTEETQRTRGTRGETQGDGSLVFLRKHKRTVPLCSSVPPSPPPLPSVINPSAGWYGDTELVMLDNACGRTAAVVVTPYPPGIPVIMTGGTITAEQLEYIKRMEAAGAEIAGISDNMIEVVK